MELLNVCLLTTVCVELLGLYLPVYMLLYEGKCMWSYGPSCPVDFPLNIFIHSFTNLKIELIQMTWFGDCSGKIANSLYLSISPVNHKKFCKVVLPGSEVFSNQTTKTLNKPACFKLHVQHQHTQNGRRCHTHTHTHPFNGPFSGTTRVSRYQKDETNLDFTEARDNECQWHQLGLCKSAPRSRQTTTPALHHSVFYRPDALPATQPTASKHWRHSVNRQFKKLHNSSRSVRFNGRMYQS